MELNKQNAEAESIIEKEKIQAKQDTAYAIADITAGLSSIIGQETAAGKAIAISSATIDTYLSASTIFKQAAKNPISIVNPAYPYLMAAPAVLAGIARVRQIASVSVPNGGGGGGMGTGKMNRDISKNMKSGGKVSSASKRADGCATKGKTRGRIV